MYKFEYIFRANTLIFIQVNTLAFLAKLFEPFMPGFTAKVYYNLAKERNDEDDAAYKSLLEAKSWKSILSFVKSGHVIKDAIPIFKRSKITFSVETYFT